MGIKLHKSIINVSFLLFLLVPNNSFSFASTLTNEPTVKLDRSFWERNSIPDGGEGNYDFFQKINAGIPKRYEIMINKTIEDLKNYNKDTFNMNLKVKVYNQKIKNKYELTVLPLIQGSKEYGRYKNKGFYLFNNQEICIGHLFLTKGNLIDYAINQPEFVTIKNMTVNANYLGNKLLVPRSEIKFYEKDHGDFIERYAMNDKYLYMQAFYPKELENFMQKRIIDILNFNYTSAKNAPINTTDEEFEVTSQRMEDQEELGNDD